MSELIFVRHAIAVERELFEGPDALRPLTKQGRQRAKKIFDKVFEQISPTRIITSPLVRAVQTAELIQLALAKPLQLEECEELKPDSSWQHWQTALKRLEKSSGDEEIFVIVGHEPLLGELFGRELGLNRPIPFKKAGIGIIDRDKELKAFIPPMFLR